MLCAARRGGQYLGVHASAAKSQQLARHMSNMPANVNQKDHKSAVCIIPPRPVWDAIQEIRLFNDKGFVRYVESPSPLIAVFFY